MFMVRVLFSGCLLVGLVWISWVGVGLYLFWGLMLAFGVGVYVFVLCCLG